ncbi:MAG: DUF1800 domain-containing protein [Candidatus Electrothrix sp.]
MKGSIVPILALLLFNSKPIAEENAAHFLDQATFGATEQSIAAVHTMGIESWVDQQLNMVSAYDSDTDDRLTYLEETIRVAKIIWPDDFPEEISTYLDPTNPEYTVFNQIKASREIRDVFLDVWLQNALHGQDQLRQRIAYALSQIIVVSTQDLLLQHRPEAIASHQDILAKHALGNYATLLKEVALSTTMGYYLTHHGNKKANPDSGTRPDENFAREIMQLFTIGLYELNLDGTTKTDAITGKPIPTYIQRDIEELSRIFTGWDSWDNSRYGSQRRTEGDLTRSMEFTAEYHDFGEKIVLDTIIPATDPASEDGETDIDAVITMLIQHPNTAPFVSKQLIKRLVTTNPSPAYVQRVAQIFLDNGSGIQGDLKAVARAILLDPEARTLGKIDNNAAKTKEPVLALTRLLRSFSVQPLNGWTKNGIVMNDFYRINSITENLGQEPLHAFTVFNFYSPDFTPSDAYFMDNHLTSPEFEIQTDQLLVNYSNFIYTLCSDYERNAMIQWYRDKSDYDQTVAEEDMITTYAEEVIGENSWRHTLMISFDQEMELFEQGLEGDSNGDFSILNRDDHASGGPKALAVQALVDHLDRKITASTMTEQQKEVLIDYLVNTFSVAETNRPQSARLMILEAVRAITTSSAYMVQH